LNHKRDRDRQSIVFAARAELVFSSIDRENRHGSIAFQANAERR